LLGHDLGSGFANHPSRLDRSFLRWWSFMNRLPNFVRFFTSGRM
jgi:hypothetical protein